MSRALELLLEAVEDAKASLLEGLEDEEEDEKALDQETSVRKTQPVTRGCQNSPSDANCAVSSCNLLHHPTGGRSSSRKHVDADRRRRTDVTPAKKTCDICQPERLSSPESRNVQ